ncbi:hypothetical protein DYB35_008142, partial [Aphanomyces astaci]
MKDPFLLEMTASEPLSLEEEQQMQVTWREDPTKATFIVFATTDTETEDEMAGDVNLFFNDDEDTANCEIDIMVAEARYRGKGVGREAVLLMMSYAVTHLHVHRFYCKINETNEPSLGLFRKYDFLLLDFHDKAAGAPTEAPDEEAAKAELAAVEAQDEDNDDESDTNEEDTNRLLYLISLYTKPAILSTDKEEWIRKPALLVLLYEAIVSQAVDYDYAPASELIENKRKYFNISQEGKSDLDFLREEELLNGLKLASKSYQPVTCYQISEKGQELVAKLGKADKSPIHDMSYDILTKECWFEICGYRRVSSVTETETVSYVSSAYVPQCLRRGGRPTLSNAHRAHECGLSDSTIKDQLDEIISLNSVSLIVSEFIPFGANQLVQLNCNLGSTERVQ